MTENAMRFEAALGEPTPFDALRTLAEALRAEGMSQQDMYRVFDEYRARHHHDVDETLYDAILDVMDFISGYCAPANRLFPLISS